MDGRAEPLAATLKVRAMFNKHTLQGDSFVAMKTVAQRTVLCDLSIAT